MQTQFHQMQPSPACTGNRMQHLARLAGRSVAALMLASIAGIAHAAPDTQKSISDDWQLCRSAAQKVERAHDLPNALLQAMSLVETGRRGPEGRHTAWPWTINAEGKGFRFANKQDALLAVRRMMADGVRSIDVGCMQVNLRYHPRAFTSLDEAFDPAANMAYAASFLQDLKARHGSWRAASARYHSYNPKLREKYATRVDKTLASERKVLAARMPATPPTTRVDATETDIMDGAEIITASTTGLGLRPTLIPGLRRGFDIPAPDATRDAASLTTAPAQFASAPHASDRSTQLAAR